MPLELSAKAQDPFMDSKLFSSWLHFQVVHYLGGNPFYTCLALIITEQDLQGFVTKLSFTHINTSRCHKFPLMTL
jgi:hypothetical protein